MAVVQRLAASCGANGIGSGARRITSLGWVESGEDDLDRVAECRVIQHHEHTCVTRFPPRSPWPNSEDRRNQLCAASFGGSMTLAASLVRLHRCQHLLLQRFQLRNRHNLGKSNGFRGDLTSPRTFSWSWPVSIAARFSIEFRLSTKAVLICIPRFPLRPHQN